VAVGALDRGAERKAILVADFAGRGGGAAAALTRDGRDAVT